MMPRWTGVVLLIATFASAQVPAQVPERPNIVILLSDDQGWADIGYNNPAVYTPRLDALAAEGLVFRDHAVMPQCTPTRVALMTGRYPSRFGGAALMASNAPAFPKGTPTIASVLKSRGYTTFLTGKWHLGSDPSHGPDQFGFDGSYGSLTGAVGMYDHRYRTGPYEHTWHRDGVLIEGSENGEHATDLVTREAVRFIEQEHDEPFFLYVPFHSVHTPLDERGRFTDEPTALDPEHPERWRHEDDIEWFHDPEGRIQAEPDPEKRLFLATVHHLDHAVGEIIDALDRTGQRERTLILFSSDNGPQGSWNGNAYPDDLRLTDFNQDLPFRGKKLDVWQGGIHVPGFANWPGVIDPGETDAPLHIVDWLPTIASIANATCPEEVDGVSLTDLLFDGEVPEERVLAWSWHSNTNRRAMRFGRWKIVHYGRPEPASAADWQLFDLDADRAETTDVSSSHPDIVEMLHARYLQIRALDAK